MFRELAKKNKLISEDACIDLLKKQKRGVLSVLGDEDYPYGMPLNHYYDEESGHMYMTGVSNTVFEAEIDVSFIPEGE